MGYRIGDAVSDAIHAKISFTLQNSKPSIGNLSKNGRKILKGLAAEKGRSTVIVNLEDYLGKYIDHIYSGPIT